MDYIRYYEDAAAYNADQTRLNPSLSYIESTGEAILEGQGAEEMIADVPEVSGFSDTTFGRIRDYVDEVRIPSGVTEIGQDAFLGYLGLTSVSIPSTVTTINNQAFKDCTNLASVNIPSGVTSIGIRAFEGCTSLASVTLPSTLTTIKQSAFKACPSLKSITIPSSVTSIGNQVFRNCTGLTDVTVEATTPPTLGATPFFYVEAGITIWVPSASLSAYKAASGWSDYADKIYAIGSEPTPYVPSGADTTIKYSDDTVKTYSVTGNLVFSELNETTYTVDQIVELRAGTGVTSIGVGYGSTSGTGAFEGATNLTYLGLPDTVTEISDRSFFGCTSLASVVFPSALVTFGNRAFQGCSALTYIKYTGTAIRTFGDYVFTNSPVSDTRIPEGVTTVGKAPFGTNPASIYIMFPSSVTSMNKVLVGGTVARKFTILAATPPTLDGALSFGTGSLTTYVPSGSLTAYRSSSQFAVNNNLITEMT